MVARRQCNAHLHALRGLGLQEVVQAEGRIEAVGVRGVGVAPAPGRVPLVVRALQVPVVVGVVVVIGVIVVGVIVVGVVVVGVSVVVVTVVVVGGVVIVVAREHAPRKRS